MLRCVIYLKVSVRRTAHPRGIRNANLGIGCEPKARSKDDDERRTRSARRAIKRSLHGPAARGASGKFLDQRTAVHHSVDPDHRGRRLYEFLKKADCRLLGNSRADHRARVRRRRVAGGGRQNGAIAPCRDPGAALVGVPSGDEHAVADKRAEDFHGPGHGPGDFHPAGAWHLHCRRAGSLVAGLSSRPDHGARHSGDCVDREFGFAGRADCRER